MRHLFIITAALTAAACMLCGFMFPPLDTSPPSMFEAYTRALRSLGPLTNRFSCVDSRISHEWCYAGEWVFTFQGGFMERKLVFVAMKPYACVSTDMDPKPWWPSVEVRDASFVAITNGAAADDHAQPLTAASAGLPLYPFPDAVTPASLR